MPPPRVLTMMIMKLQKLILLSLVLFPFTAAHGARIHELREKASHVVVGEVTGVFKSDGKEYIGYVVRIRVEALEKGEGAAKGQYFYAECFERKPHAGPGSPTPGANGHSGVPKVGDRVRVFTNEEKSINEGVYPNWYDVLPKADEN